MEITFMFTSMRSVLQQVIITLPPSDQRLKLNKTIVAVSLMNILMDSTAFGLIFQRYKPLLFCDARYIATVEWAVLKIVIIHRSRFSSFCWQPKKLVLFKCVPVRFWCGRGRKKKNKRKIAISRIKLLRAQN